MSEVAKHKSGRSDAALTPTIRIAYPFVHEKRTKRANGAPLKTPRYDATLLFPKLNADPAQCANYQFLAKHCMDAAAKAWPGAGWPAGGHWPIQDGDAPPKPKVSVPGAPVAPVDPNKYAWRRGNWVVEVTHYVDPGPRIAVMQNGLPVEIPAKVVAGKQLYKGGDFGIVSIHAWTFQNEKFGCNFGFEGILWMGEGEAIGSSGPRSAAQMFGTVPGTPGMPAPAAAPQYAAPAPPQQYAPPAAPVAPVPQQYAAPAASYAPPMPGQPPAPPAPPAPGPLPPMPGR